MPWGKVFLVILMVLIFSSFVWSAPVLIKIDFTSQEQVEAAKSLGVKAYQRFDNTYLAEIEASKLAKLSQKGIAYKIADEEAWSEKYYIVSEKRATLPVPITAETGKVLLEDTDWKVLKLNPGQLQNLRERHVFLSEIPKREIPLRYIEPQVTYFQELPADEKLLNIADSISQDSLYSYNLRLQNFQTRFVVSDSCTSAAMWLLEKFKSFGIDSVYLDTFSYFDWVIYNDWRTTYNVVAVVKGKANPDKTMVVGGHFDSVTWGISPGPMIWAPGADDNGSGTAATLEIARRVAQDTLAATVTFVCFSGEELGLYGSYYHAYKHFSLGTDIQFMLNMDMIGYKPNNSTVELQKDITSQAYAQLMAQLAGQYGLSGALTNGGANSDHWPFLEVGYPAVFAAEYIFNYQGWHTNTDLVDSMNFDYMTRVVKMGAATVDRLANSPRPVENIKIVDSGTGNSLYVTWPRNRNEKDILWYTLFYGTQSDQLTGYGIFTDTSVLLPGLSEGTTYYIGISAMNSGFKESPFMTLKTGSSQSLPRAPAGVSAQAAYKSVRLYWRPNLEADLSHYRIYRSENSGGPYQLWADGVTDTFYTDSVTIQGGVRYYYQIAAVDSDSNQGVFSSEVSAMAVTLDQGVLVLDETGEILDYGDESQDSFYNALFGEYDYFAYDYSGTDNAPTLSDLGPYGAVIWLDDDMNTHYLLDHFDLLQQYLDAGGKVLISSWNSFLYLPGGLPRSFYAGEFIYDYLKISAAARDSVQASDFIGATGESGLGYPNVAIDSIKPISSWNGVLRSVAKIDLRPEAEVIYYYDSKNDRTGYEGAICGGRYLGSDYQVVFLTFPLFYLNFADAQALVDKVMTDFGIPTPVKPEEPPIAQLPKEFDLYQNYPNPFNPATTIRFSLPQASEVNLEVFNILGQKVNTLLKEKRIPGTYTVTWDGRNASGEKVTSGIYFYRLVTEDFKSVRKMVLLR